MSFIRIMVKKIVNVFGYNISKKNNNILNTNFGIDLFMDIRRLRETPKFNIHLLKINPSIVFDIGANIGQTSLKLAYHFSDARIYSFEPIEDTFNQLKDNIQHHPNVMPFKKAFSSLPGQKEIYIYPSSLLSSLVPESPMMSSTCSVKKEVIEVDTLDAFCFNNDINNIDLLKVDTEGYDLEVIKGAKILLQKKAINFIYFEFFYIGSDSSVNTGGRLIDIHEYLKQFGYRPVTFYTDGIHTEHTGGFYNALYMRWDA